MSKGQSEFCRKNPEYLMMRHYLLFWYFTLFAGIDFYVFYNCKQNFYISKIDNLIKYDTWLPITIFICYIILRIVQEYCTILCNCIEDFELMIFVDYYYYVHRLSILCLSVYISQLIFLRSFLFIFLR